MNIAQKLGFKEDDKLLIIHADDVGLSHSENRATKNALQNGLVNSYSLMVPCPWFYEMAVFAKENPQFDYGIHLTLTCEWENYRFGPILPVCEVPSLVDQNGHFFKTREELRKKADADHVEKELGAQIQKALDLGLDPSHLDCHMYSVGASPKFFEAYRRLGKEYGLPIMVSEQLMKMVGLDPSFYIHENDLLVDHIPIPTFENFESGNLRKFYEDLFENMKSGLNVILIHPAYDDDEMKGITVNHPNFGSEWRQIDLDFFSDRENETKISENGIKLISWRDIKRLL